MPPLNSLRAFDAAARLGSFVRAGAELHVTSAAISHQIKELERSLGVTLFQRLPRGVELTDAGRRYSEEVARALALIAKATANLDAPTIAGSLRLSAPQSFAQFWLAPRLSSLIGRIPELAISISGSDRLADVRGGEADVAIRFGTGNYPGLRCELLFADLAAPLIATDLLAQCADSRTRTVLEDCVLLEDEQARADEPWMTWQPWLRDAKVARHADDRRIQFSDSGLALGACQSGAGACIGRMSLAFDFLRRRQMTALLPWRTTEFYPIPA